MTNRYRIITFNLLRQITKYIINFRHAMPHCCMLCNIQTNHYKNQLCDVCRDDLPFPDQLCIGCSLPLLMSHTKWCGACQNSQPPFPLVTACYYQPPIKQLLSALKYRHQLIVCHELAKHLARRIFKLLDQSLIEKPQALIPVPLHWQRRYSRGFNQAELIAIELSRYLDIPVIYPIKRIKKTTSQASLNAQERNHNLDNAFKMSKYIDVTSIAIIDDVYTTGATMREMSDEILKQHQHLKIQHWAIARTIIHD